MGKNKSIAGFVLGIVGVVLTFLGALGSIIGLPVAIVGLVLSIQGRKALKENEQPTGLATAAFIIGIVATALTGISFFTCGICVLCAAGVGSGVESALNSIF